ncbi:hypothetical protein CTY88_02790 [Acinetobacter seifertii]|nr:hypothetical protein [Acinetobacter seifertii]
MKGKVYFIGGEYDGEEWEYPVCLGDIVPRIKRHSVGDLDTPPTITSELDEIKYKAELYSVAGDKRIFLVDPDLSKDQAIIKIEKHFF